MIRPKFVSIRKRRTISTDTLGIESDTLLSAAFTSDQRGNACFLLSENLIRRGLLSSAKKVIERMVGKCSTLPEVISIIDFAEVRGVNLCAVNYGFMIRRLMASGRPLLAEAIFSDRILNRGIEPNRAMMNCMVICFCRLGNLREAVQLFDKMLELNSRPCAAACNLLLAEFCKHKRALQGFDCFMRMNALGLHLEFWSCNLLVDELCFAGHIDEALKVYDVMSVKNDCRKTEHVCRLLIHCLCRRGRAIEADCICRSVESRGFLMNIEIYTCIIYRYCKNREMRMAMRLFIRMLKLGFDPDNYVYNTLINGCVKLGAIDKAWILYDQMKSPDPVTHHIIMNEYCRNKNLDFAVALALFNSVESPSVHFYTALIAGLYRKSRSEEAEELLNDMLRNKVSPDHVLFFTLMRRYSKGHELELCHIVLRYVAEINDCFSLQSGSETTDTEKKIEALLHEITVRKPDLAFVAFTIFVCALCSSGNLCSALANTEKMIGLGFVPSFSTFNSLIKCLSHGGNLRDAESMIELMKNTGVPVTESTYLVLIHELCGRHDVNSAISVLDRMERSSTRPSVAIYDTIIDCLSDERRIGDAADMFGRMLVSCISPDEVVYTTMINAYAKNGWVLEAGMQFERMIERGLQPDIRSYTALIYGLIRGNRTREGCVYLGRMLDRGFLPNVVLFTALIDAFFRKGETQFAYSLARLMESSFRIEPDVVYYTVLVSRACDERRVRSRRPAAAMSKKKKELLYLLGGRNFPSGHLGNDARRSSDFVVRLMEDTRSGRVRPDLYLYNAMIDAFLKMGKTETAYECFRLMGRPGGLSPNQVTMTILVNDRVRNGDTDGALVLFNRMNAGGFVVDRMAYNAIIRGLCAGERLTDALCVLHVMYRRGFYPNFRSFRMLIACSRRRNGSDGTETTKIYEEMLDHGFT